MTPPPDPSYTEPLAGASATLLTIKPIFWFAGMIVAGMLWYNALDHRLANVEDGIETLMTIVCSDSNRSSDSACKKVGR